MKKGGGVQVLRTCPDCNVDQETQNENIVQKPRTNVRNERVIFPD